MRGNRRSTTLRKSARARWIVIGGYMQLLRVKVIADNPLRRYTIPNLSIHTRTPRNATPFCKHSAASPAKQIPPTLVGGQVVDPTACAAVVRLRAEHLEPT